MNAFDGRTNANARLARSIGITARRPGRTVRRLGGIQQLNSMSPEARQLMFSLAVKAQRSKRDGKTT